MYRLLIVDDEEIIVDGLYELLKAQKDFEIDIYKAYSASEALQWLSRTRIDIVLSDIMMPEMDGMQLHEAICKQWPTCKVIFLTGYEKFDYLYGAMKKGDVQYVLKSEDPDTVIHLIHETLKQIDENHELQNMIHDAKEQFQVANSLFQSDFLLHLLRGDAHIKHNAAMFEELNLPLSEKEPVMLALIVPTFSSEIEYSRYRNMLFMIKQQIEQYVWIKVRHSIVINRENQFCLLIQPREEEGYSTQQLIAFLRGGFELIQNRIKTSENIDVDFLIADDRIKWEHMSDTYRQMQSTYQRIKVKGIDFISTTEELQVQIEEESDTSFMLEEEAIDYTYDYSFLQHFLASGERALFFRKLDPILERLKSIRSQNHPYAIEIYYHMALNLQQFINQHRINEKVAFTIGQNKLMRFEMHGSWEEAADYIRLLSDAIFDIRAEEASNREDRIINKIHKFIDDNLSSDLSLVRISEYIYMNPSYLSRFYKQRTGGNLSEYIDTQRIRHVIELMEKGNVKVYELGMSVGYTNPGSFTRFFKKMTHTTPLDYYETYIHNRKV